MQCFRAYLLWISLWKRKRKSFVFFFFSVLAYYIEIQVITCIRRNRIEILSRKIIRLPVVVPCELWNYNAPVHEKTIDGTYTRTREGNDERREMLYARRVKRISGIGLLRRDVRTEISLLWKRERSHDETRMGNVDDDERNSPRVRYGHARRAVSSEFVIGKRVCIIET